MKLARFSSSRTLINFIGRIRCIGNVTERVLQNGILEHDDYYRLGLPMAAKFQLPIVNEIEKKDTKQILTTIFNQHSHIDPYAIVSKEIRSVSQSINELIGSDHPVLKSIAEYFFQVQGKRIRPTILLVLARAMAQACGSPIFNEKQLNSLPPTEQLANHKILTSQLRLSQITEMIHTASLLHDDVIDDATSRRGVPSLNRVYGNKLAILGGDFLLARASVALARLRDPQVIEIMSTIIEHLVKGEIMQFKPRGRSDVFDRIDYYILKSYYKTASLISGSCKSISILAGYGTKMQEIAEEYGKNIGLAFQIVDDLLDFSGTAKNMGKETQSDLKQGLATAPVLYAAELYPELETMIDRKFNQPGDIQRALECVKNSDSLERARELALKCGEKAVAAALQLPSSDAQSACVELVHRVLTRDS